MVLGLKDPGLGQRLAALQVSHRLLLGPLPRPAILESITAGGLVVALPMAEGEGFFLPALKAMDLGRPLLVPDAGGTRAFCRDGVNCLQLAAAVLALRRCMGCWISCRRWGAGAAGGQLLKL